MTLLRAAGTADAGHIARIQVRAWQAAHAGAFPPGFLDTLSVEERVEGWAAALAGPPEGDHTLVAEAAGTVVGFVHLGASLDADPGPGPVGQVRALYVDPAAWSRGVGRMLAAAAQELLAGAGFTRLTLWVLESNRRGRSFYEALGWVPDGAVRTDRIGGVDTPMVRYGRRAPAVHQ